MFIHKLLANLNELFQVDVTEPAKPQREKKSIESWLEEAKSWPQTSKRQFAMRFLAAHLNNSSFEGSSSDMSTAYWIELLELWIRGEGILIPFNFSTVILKELLHVLEDYQGQLKYKNNCSARDILDYIKVELNERGYAYTCLGYINGPLNQGHAIPLRIDYCKRTKTITVHFLNLGEGVSLNPQLTWANNYPCYNFRSFPITFSEEDFFGAKGLDLFSRQITLLTEHPTAQVAGYSASDVYGAFYTVGKASGNFSSSPELRSKKPQVSYVCADMAVELVIHDFLIENGVEKRDIRRFFCNEELCTLLSFPHAIALSKKRDEWTMLEKATQEFSISVVKKGECSLEPEELRLCKEAADFLTSRVAEGMKSSIAVRIEPLQIIGYGPASTIFDDFKPNIESRPDTKEEMKLPSISSQPENFLEWITEIKQIVMILQKENLNKRCFYFLSREFSKIPIPKPSETDFWDRIPQQKIPEILKNLCHLMVPCKVSFHKQAILIHTCYAICDKLIRRIHTELKGFGPPFILNIHDKFQFPLLTNGEENERWQNICHYFESILHKHKIVLFAFHERSFKRDVRKALNKLTENNETTDPTASHLKFLSQFLDHTKHNFTEQYVRLWQNYGFPYLSRNLYYYQYLAQTCWIHYMGGTFIDVGSPLCALEEDAKKDLYISYRTTNLNTWETTSFTERALKEIAFASTRTYLDNNRVATENQAACLKDLFQSQWIRIAVNPTLQITSTIQWTLDNLHYVRDDAIKDQIEKKLFAPHALLIKCLRDTPSLVSHFRFLITEGLKFYQENPQDLPHLLFFIRLGCAFETHSRKANVDYDDNLLLQYEKLLLTLIGNGEHLFDLYSHLRFLYTVTLPSETSREEMLQAGFWVEKNNRHSPYIPNWLIQEIQCVEDLYGEIPRPPPINPSTLSDPLFEKLTFSQGDVFEKSGAYIVTEGKTDKALFIITEKLEVQKLDGRGHALPYKLLKNNDTHFFSRLGLQENDVFCWIDSEGRLAELEIVPFRLRFKGEMERETWILRSLDFPNFFLSKEQTLHACSTFNGALILENFLGEKKVLVAPNHLERDDSDFTTEVTLTKRKLPHVTAPYFRFDHFEASLFLSFLFASMRDYKKALHYLQQGREYSYHTDFFQNFPQLRDESPEALAFNLRLGIFLFKNHTQVIHEGFGNQGTALTKNVFYEWLSTTFVSYLRHCSELCSRIPAYIRLQYEEELFLLSHLEKVLVTLSKNDLIRIRKELLAANKMMLQIKPSTYTFSSKAFTIVTSLQKSFRCRSAFPVLSGTPQLEPDPSFVRMTLAEIQMHFVKLYERARLGYGELDLFYLAQSASKRDSETVSAYALVLYIVFAFPEKFREYTFCLDEEKNTQTFLKIIQQADKLNLNSEKINSAFTTTIFFDYSAEKILEITPTPPLRALTWEFDKAWHQDLIAYHFSLQADFLEKWFDITQKPTIKHSRPHLFGPLKGTPVLQDLVETFQRGYLECDCKDIFTLKKGKIIAKCLQEAEDLYEQKTKQSEALHTQIEKEANMIPSYLFLDGLRQVGGDLPKITVEGILTEALNAQNPNLVKQANPSLCPPDIEWLLVMCMKYHILKCHIAQLAKGIKVLKKDTSHLQAFGEAMAVYGAFDPIGNPELLLLQSHTKVSLRKEQAECIKWLKTASGDGLFCKTILFEFPAGGGKGTIFTPILTKLSRNKGLTPVTVSTPSLYQVERKKQRTALKKAFGINLEVLEIALNVKATDQDFKWIYEQLNEYSESDALKIIPEVYYTLDLKYQLALESGDVGKVRYLSLILDLFFQKCVVFIDEGRINLSPFTQAKIGFGKQTPLPTCERKLFLIIYQILVDPHQRLNDGRKVCMVIPLMQNRQALMSERDREQVRLFLIEKLSDHPFLKIPNTEKTNIQKWWTDPLMHKPSWLVREESKKTEIAHVIRMAKLYFCHLYDRVMESVGKMRHQRSLIPNEEIEVLARKGRATRAYFENPYITLILTIHGTLQRGLANDQCKKLIELLHNEWPFEIGQQSLDKHPGAIFWYLEHQILPQIKISSHYLSVNPQHFLHAFKTAAVYSAFLGPKTIYDSSTQLFRSNTSFAAHVIHEISHGEMERLNSFRTPLEFFQHMWKINPGHFNDFNMLIDVGGMLREFSNVEIATAFFEFIKDPNVNLVYDGIVFPDDSGTAEEGDLNVWLNGSERPVTLPEGDIVSGLASLGYKWEDLQLLIYVDPLLAIGLDILLPENKKAFVLLGENLTIGDLIQGLMRKRDFLHNPRIVFWLLETLAAQIEATCHRPCSPETLRDWTLFNEAAIQEKELALHAMQKKEYESQKSVRMALAAKLHQPKEQIEIWQKAREKFVTPYRMTTADLGGHVYLYSHQDLKQEQQKIDNRDIQPDVLPPLDASLDISKPNLLNLITSNQFSISARILFDSTSLTQTLFLSHKYVTTAKTGDCSLKQKYLKPVQYFLVLYEQKKLIACALSDEEAVFFQQQLMIFSGPMERNLALFTASGILAQNAKGGLAFSEKSLVKLSRLDWFQDVVIDIGLLSCRLRYPNRLKQRILLCPDLKPLWNVIKSCHSHSDAHHTHAIENIIFCDDA